MILVDTSVWIRFLANREPYASRMSKLLDLDVVALRQAGTVTHAEVVHFVRHHALYGSGIGWIDAHLLASVRAGGMLLWTADTALEASAKLLHVQYSPHD